MNYSLDILLLLPITVRTCVSTLVVFVLVL